MPYGLQHIGNRAFSDCESLKEIRIPDNVTFLGAGSFAGCRNLEKITLSNRITTIYYGTFGYCESMESIVIPYSVKEINQEGGYEYCQTFGYCKNLRQVVTENPNLELPLRAFDNTPWLVEQYEKMNEQARIREQNWKRAGLCASCGGSFKGLFTKTCTSCGRKKNY